MTPDQRRALGRALLLAGPVTAGVSALVFMFLGLSGVCTGTMTSERASFLTTCLVLALVAAALIWIVGLWFRGEPPKDGPST